MLYEKMSYQTTVENIWVASLILGDNLPKIKHKDDWIKEIYIAVQDQLLVDPKLAKTCHVEELIATLQYDIINHLHSFDFFRVS